MKKFKIYAGLGEGFGGAKYLYTYEFEDRTHAEEVAYEEAIEIYEGYVGDYGLKTIDEIMDENGVSEDEAQEMYIEERENWLDYYVKESSDLEDDK